MADSIQILVSVVTPVILSSIFTLVLRKKDRKKEEKKRAEELEQQKLTIYICDEIGWEPIYGEDGSEDYRFYLKIVNESQYADATNIKVAMSFIDDIGREICKMKTRDFEMKVLRSKHSCVESKKGSELVIKFEKIHIDHNVKYQTCDSIKELLNSRPNFIISVAIQVQNTLNGKPINVPQKYEKNKIQQGVFVLGSYELQKVNPIEYFDYAE